MERRRENKTKCVTITSRFIVCSLLVYFGEGKCIKIALALCFLPSELLKVKLKMICCKLQSFPWLINTIVSHEV